MDSSPPEAGPKNLFTWTNLGRRDKPWAEFSTLEVVARHALNLLLSIAIRFNLELKTRPKQLLGYLLLDIALHAVFMNVCDKL